MHERGRQIARQSVSSVRSKKEYLPEGPRVSIFIMSSKVSLPLEVLYRSDKDSKCGYSLSLSMGQA